MGSEHSEPQGWPHGDEYDNLQDDTLSELMWDTSEWRKKLENDISPQMGMLDEKHMSQRLWDRYSALKRAGLIEVVPERGKPFVASRVPESLEAGLGWTPEFTAAWAAKESE